MPCVMDNNPRIIGTQKTVSLELEKEKARKGGTRDTSKFQFIQHFMNNYMYCRYMVEIRMTIQH